MSNLDELKKEVKEYISHKPTEGAKDFIVYKIKVGENAFFYVVEHKNELSLSDWVKMYEGTERECYQVVGYLDSAEPREKRIEELEKENIELRKEWQEQVQKATDEGYARTLQTIQLSKARDIIKNLMLYVPVDLKEYEEAKQFLNENSTYERIQKAKYNYTN
jgi:hypothetical protein